MQPHGPHRSTRVCDAADRHLSSRVKRKPKRTGVIEISERRQDSTTQHTDELPKGNKPHGTSDSCFLGTPRCNDFFFFVNRLLLFFRESFVTFPALASPFLKYSISLHFFASKVRIIDSSWPSPVSYSFMLIKCQWLTTTTTTTTLMMMMTTVMRPAIRLTSGSCGGHCSYRKTTRQRSLLRYML